MSQFGEDDLSNFSEERVVKVGGVELSTEEASQHFETEFVDYEEAPTETEYADDEYLGDLVYSDYQLEPEDHKEFPKELVKEGGEEEEDVRFVTSSEFLISSDRNKNEEEEVKEEEEVEEEEIEEEEAEEEVKGEIGEPEGEEVDDVLLQKYAFEETTPSSESSTESSSVKSSSTCLTTDRLSFLKGTKLDTSLTPFYLKWSFGVGLNTPVLNLTSKERTVVCYAASHVGVIYDYASKEMNFLPGHSNLISSLSVDDEGKWLVTADKGEDSTIIVWDSEERPRTISIYETPVNTIFNPHPDCGTAVVAISGNAKYLATIGKETRSVFNFWLWTYGSDKPDDSYTIKSSQQGAPVKICFNPNVQEHIMLAFEKQIVFFQWNTEKRSLFPPVFPQIKGLKKFGLFTDCTYIDTCHECVASTTEGYAFVFGSTLYTMPFEEIELQNDKIFTKAIKISASCINCIQTCDGVIVTGDSLGHIKFYDKTLRLLYWCQNFSLPPVTAVSFNLDRRLYKMRNVLDDDSECEFDNCLCEDRSQEFEYLYTQLVPSDATLQRLPFVVRDFVIATADGRIATIDYMHNKCSFFFRKAEAPVTALDTHEEKPYLVIAYANGCICLYNYLTKDMIIEEKLPEEIDEETENLVLVTAMKYSPQSLQLVCGMDNGSILFLDPIALTPKKSSGVRVTKAKVVKFKFSVDSKFLGYFDESSTIVIMKYSSKTNAWRVLGKIRSHYKPIRDIQFTPYLPSRFFSIGEDRFLVEYDLEESRIGSVELINRERIEQSAVPVSFIYYPPKDDSKDRYLLVSDNQFKFKLMHDVTYMCRSVILGPAYGCYSSSPVRKMIILNEHHNHYLIFANNNHIGIQLLPANGSPYRYVGTIGHPTKIVSFRTCRKGKHLFTFGEEDNCVLMWDINVLSVQLMEKLGGVELEPFYCLIEGGLHGWLFKEMQDLFYYMQILHQGENTFLPRTVTDLIPIVELPDLMRACGFYPSEFEIENIITDIKYCKYDQTKILQTEASFQEFVKLYINHRPAHGVSINTLRDNFESFCLAGEGPGSNCITGQSFVESLCERGEVFTVNKAYTCLATLMHALNEDDNHANIDFTFLPKVIDFSAFLEDVLGMDMTRQTVDSAKSDAESDDYQGLC